MRLGYDAAFCLICCNSNNIWMASGNTLSYRADQIMISRITRSTPRAQTSAMPSLKSVKQSTQAWNSVAYCFLCPNPEPCVQGVKPTILQMLQIVPCVIANISWRFHENPLDFTVVLLTNAPGAPRRETVKQSRHVWNSLANYFLCHACLSIKKFMKIRSPVFP